MRRIMKSYIFWKFKYSRIMIAILSIIALILLYPIVIYTKFTLQDLKELAILLINTSIVLAALWVGVVSFSANSKNNNYEKNRELVINYIGEILFLLSVGVLGNIIQYLPAFIFDELTIKIYALLMIINMVTLIIKTTVYLMKYFKIK